MWLATPSVDSLTRPRVAIALVSTLAAVSLGYYTYSLRVDPALSGPGLHRSNAVRRGARRSRRGSNASIHPDENADADGDADANADGDPMQHQNDGEAPVEEWWNDPNAMMPPARAGHNIVSLLFRVSEDNARRNACVHRGCACNACGVTPIRGVRYRCANCADFDLCETCESQGVHIKTHIFYKINVPAPPFGPRQMQPVWYAGHPDSRIRNLPRPLIAKLSKDTGFERPEIEAFWEQFTFMANTEWREDPDGLQLAMDKKTFERCLVPSGGSRHATPNLIHDRMFSFYDTNDDDLIGFAEFLKGLAFRKRKDKLYRVFQGYDIDGDGYVSRRDFLRMFRAYYVLYKQMHRDILDGLDDQLMGSTEAQHHVTGRQPLSGFFGREGRLPPAEGNNRNEGKVFHSNGDVELEDDKVGAVTEDKGDTSTREDVLTHLYARSSNAHSLMTLSQLRSPDSEPDTPYWDALLDPPGSLDDLPGLLNGSRSDAVEMDLDMDVEMTSPEDEDGPGNHSDAENRSRSGDADAFREASVDAEAVNPEQFTNTMPTESQIRARVTAQRRQMAPEIERKRRSAARKQLHERWKRRHFYLDEEEGGVEPEGWESNQDVLDKLQNSAATEAESSKTTQPLSPRSRSSSKVRFAEDTDDVEIRSNPSTSSRSVPERWGGFEIPEEERDAGKEILYQVTQQAFNELLDAIFKETEDLALAAAETKTERDKYRHLFEHMDPDDEGARADETEEPDEKARPSDPSDDGKPVHERSLEELLLTSGYTVDPSLAQEASADGGDEETPRESESHEGDAVVEDGHESEHEYEHEHKHEENDVQAEEYRDPTLPQFRPNSDATEATLHDATPASVPAPAPAPASTTPSRPATRRLKSALKNKSADNSLSGQTASSTKTKVEKKAEPMPSRHKLAEWKRLDMDERKAEQRGGWGRLDFEEFEAIYKRQENSGNRLDYLGSWVDFCIP